MSYTVCPNCGQKALTVATRCPGCGAPIEAQFLRHSRTAPKEKQLPRGLLIGGVVILLLGGNAAWQLIRMRRASAVRPVVSAPASVVQSAPESRAEPELPAVESPGAGLPVSIDSPSPPPAPGPDASSTVSRAAAARDTASAPPENRWYASTWMNVRAGRSGSAPVVRVLRPGEVVQVDSLRQGWFRLVSGPEPLGYVDRRLLDSSPPTVSP